MLRRLVFLVVPLVLWVPFAACTQDEVNVQCPCEISAGGSTATLECGQSDCVGGRSMMCNAFGEAIDNGECSGGFDDGGGVGGKDAGNTPKDGGHSSRDSGSSRNDSGTPRVDSGRVDCNALSRICDQCRGDINAYQQCLTKSAIGDDSECADWYRNNASRCR